MPTSTGQTRMAASSTRLWESWGSLGMTSSHARPEVSIAWRVWPLGKLSPPPVTGSRGRGRSTTSLNTSLTAMSASPTSTSAPARQPSRHDASAAPASIVT